jgi:predicted HicB family RNase H-like nuclease
MDRKLRVVPDVDAPYVDPRRKLTLRLDDPLADWLAAQARVNGRSLNAEIVVRLRRSRDAYRQP